MQRVEGTGTFRYVRIHGQGVQLQRTLVADAVADGNANVIQLPFICHHVSMQVKDQQQKRFFAGSPFLSEMIPRNVV
jgi:hypothetical protein